MAGTTIRKRATQLKSFLRRKPGRSSNPIMAVSTFSGCGLSDTGYALAGFKFLAQVERDEVRAEIGQANFPSSHWFPDTVKAAIAAVCKLVKTSTDRLDVLIATPPCQGLSSSNPSRGKRRTEKAWRNSTKNRLILDVLPLVKRLKPRVIIAENVRQVLTHRARCNGRVSTVPELLGDELKQYELFTGSINVADYGVPQIRRRAIIVAVHKEESWLEELNERKLLPWPKSTHSENGDFGLEKWATVREWLRAMRYASLDSRSEKQATGSQQLHFVPSYDKDRYQLVSNIPKHTGRSAYENDRCPNCKRSGIATDRAHCPTCKKPLVNRPIVQTNGRARLIKGFKSSYRRMPSNRPASTVTTNSSHIGSDNKIHPWENRVLSILECADLQTVPRFFDWSVATDSNRTYLIRNLIGEAFPPYFTYLHGKVIRALLNGSTNVFSNLAKSQCSDE